MARARQTDRSSGRYAKLEPTIRRVSRAAIQKKWKKLSEATQDKLRAEFTSLQKPLTVGKGRGRKDIEAHEAIDLVLKLCLVIESFRLEKRLPRMPFPPSALDNDFDFEATIERKRSLDCQLIKTTHAINILEGEITREQESLDKEEAELERLQKDLKTNDVLRRRRVKNVHPLASSFTNIVSKISDSTDKIYCATSAIDSSRPSSNDPSLAQLVAQLSDHLYSMQNNSKLTVGVKDAISNSQAALDIVIGSALVK
ncbi:MAG: hypothetical protein Q9160_006774 [Pyrenula sp. 1 TL-2023]